MTAEIDALVVGWFDLYRHSIGTRADRVGLEHGEPKSAVEAREAVDEICWTPGHPMAIDLARALLSGATSEREFVAVAVGPLEDLFSEQGDAVIDEVETLARGDESLRRALSLAALPARHEARLRRLFPA